MEMRKIMDSKLLRCFLFPHMALSERDYRHLYLLVPHLTILQVLRPPALPEWGQEHFSVWSTIRAHEHAKQIELFLKGYRDFADLHREHSVLASLSQDMIEKNFRESRFQIQGEVRGKHTLEPGLREALLVEAAVFLEVARDLDEKHMELEVDFSRAERLDEDFREILGIADDKDVDEALETLSSPLVSDKENLSFMLPRRIAFWLRLFCNNPPEDLPVMVATSPEVIDELVDPLKTEHDRLGTPMMADQFVLASLPALDHLDAAAFLRLHHELRTSPVLISYWSRLEDVLRNPADATAREMLMTAAKDLEQHVEAFCKHEPHSCGRRVQLIINCTGHCTRSDFWRCIDKRGFKEWGDYPNAQSSPFILLTVQSDDSVISG
jgi:hypothetical protein